MAAQESATGKRKQSANPTEDLGKNIHMMWQEGGYEPGGIRDEWDARIGATPKQ